MGRIGDWDSEQLRILRTNYGTRYDIWFVRRGGRQYSTWHAKPIKAAGSTMDSDSPEALVKLLAAADREAATT